MSPFQRENVRFTPYAHQSMRGEVDEGYMSRAEHWRASKGGEDEEYTERGYNWYKCSNES